MFTKGNITYSEAFKYLRHKEHNSVLMYTKDSPENYIEEEFTLPLKVEVGKKEITIGGYFIVSIKDFSYSAIKMAVIKMRYSNDDQIALILNKDSSEEDAFLYQKMQEWRELASYVSKKVIELK